MKKADHRKKYRNDHHSWKGGSYINDSGYVMVYNPDHSRASSNGYVREHIVMAEKALGKALPELAQIHHFGKRHNNGKIVLCEDQEYHRLLHIRTAALDECGHANYRKCRFCKQYDNPIDLYIRHRDGRSGWIVYHRKCENEYRRLKR